MYLSRDEERDIIDRTFSRGRENSKPEFRNVGREIQPCGCGPEND